MKIVFWLALVTILYIWVGYYFLLLIFSRSKQKTHVNFTNNYPKVTILISAYNEEQIIGKRIENILGQDYPRDLLEVIVASDGSSDKTAEIARSYKDVRVLSFKENRGRATIQNEAVREAAGEIVVFTDAETVFELNFVSEIVKYFLDREVGCVVGNLFYKTKEDPISESEGLYWKLEKKLRELEGSIGILATASGACMAAKKELWRTLSPIGDCDFITPLDVILQGYKVVYAADAVAFDFPPSSIKGEFKTRIRQTSKNFIGTLKRWKWKGWIKHPLVSWGLLSHKILRWLTPFFMLGAFLSNVFLFSSSIFYKTTFILQLVFYLAAITGLIGELTKKRLPVASTIFSFCVASTGMGIGVIKGLLGKAPATYKTEN